MASCMILNVRDTIANKIDNILFSWSAYCNRRMFEIRKKTRVSGAQWARRTQGYVFFVLMLGKQECQKEILTWSSSVQSLTCPTLWDPMNCSTPDFPVHHQLLELTQTHVYRIGDAIQPSHPLAPFSSCLQSFPASGSFPMTQFFASGGQSIEVSASASVLPVNTQDWSPLGWTGWISLQSKGLSRVFSNTTVQKHQFFGAQLSLQSNSHIHTWPLEKP